MPSPLTRRLAQIMWVGDHLADIESDMSVFHRVDDIWAMPPARFFALAYRLPAYRGVMREVALAEQRDAEDEPERRPAAARTATVPARRTPAARDRPVTKAALHDPAFKGIFSFA